MELPSAGDAGDAGDVENPGDVEDPGFVELAAINFLEWPGPGAGAVMGGATAPLGTPADVC